MFADFEPGKPEGKATMRRESSKRSVGIAIIVLLLAVPGAFIGDLSKMAGAAPSLNNLGTGNKTVSWDFSDPADYTVSNVSVGGTAGLEQTSGVLMQTTDSDFSLNGTWDTTNLTIAGGAVAARQGTEELVTDGTFVTNASWRFLNSTDGNITAEWNWTDGTGDFTHDRPPAPALQFDDMDSGAGTTWFSISGGVGPPWHTVQPAIQDAVYIEPTASLRLDADFKNEPNNFVGVWRSGAWVWSLYNRLSVWFNTSYVGPQVMLGYLHLEAGMSQFNTSSQEIGAGWKQYYFDMSSFSGIGAVTHIQFRFTNVTNVNGVSIWTDDIWLYHFDSITQSASISQELSKPDFTDSGFGSVFLSFNYSVSSPANLTNANLTATINNTLWSSPPIAATAATPWTQAGPFDVSQFLTGKGLFNLSFVVSLSLFTPFATSLVVQIDNVSLTVPDYHNGSYESIPRDLGHAVRFDNISFAASSHPDTNVTVEVRGGWSSDANDSSWTPWEKHFTSPATLLNNTTGRYIQYRVNLNTTNASAPVSFDWINFTFHRYVDGGSVQTIPWIAPDQVIKWHVFDANYTLDTDTSISFFVSNDSGVSWISAAPGTSLEIGGDSISIKADLSTANTTFTPHLFDFNVTYEFLGPLYRIKVSPAIWPMTADEQVTFTAKAWDQWWHDIAPFTPVWTDDDPVGSVDIGGLYTAGMAGNWHVCASSLGVIDCANVTVSRGELKRLIISPTVASVQAGTQRAFTARGEDADGNDVPLTTTSWTTDVGWFNGTTSVSATFAAGQPAVGHVWAMHDSPSGLLVAQADVTVTVSTLVDIQGRVPDVGMPEDTQAGSLQSQLNLSPYLPPGQNKDDLMWYMQGKNQSLYSVLGERRLGQHLFTFSPQPDAFEDDSVTLWLENRTGARDSQPLWVNITPVNDPPVFYDLPILQVKAEMSYSFEYTPYIFDIDTPKDLLILSTDDPVHAKVQGLKVNYTFDSSFVGLDVYVKLRISDAQPGGVSNALQIIKVVGGSNTCPHVTKPLPPVAMTEDVPMNSAFPETLANYFGDADGDILAYTFSYVPHLTIWTWLSPPSFIQVNITSELNWYGLEYVTVRAIDPSACFAEQTVRLTVNPVNDPPELNWHDDIYVKYDMPSDPDLTDFVSDVDNPMSDLTLASNDSQMSNVDVFTLHLLVPWYRYKTVNSIPLSLSLTDGLAMVWSNITVRVGNNTPPMLNPGRSLPDVSFDEDTKLYGRFDLDDYFIDSDGPQPLTYTVMMNKVIVEVDGGNNFVNLSAPLNWNGQEVIHVKASDGNGFVIGRFTVRVIPVNDAPVLDPIEDVHLQAGEVRAIDLRQYVHDVDNNITELKFSTTSAHAVCVGYILVLDYRGGVPSELVTLTVNDSQKQDSKSFSVIVAAQPPVDGTNPPLWAQILWPWSLLLLVVLGIVAGIGYNKVLDKRYTMEDAFLVGKEGRLIMHTTRHLRADRDEDILAGMLTAIQMFIKDSFKEEGGDLRNFQFGEREVMVERGKHFYFAAIFAGEPPANAPQSLTDFTEDVEASFGPILEGWSGDADDVRGLRSFMDAFVAHRRYKKGDFRKYVKKPGA